MVSGGNDVTIFRPVQQNLESPTKRAPSQGDVFFRVHGVVSPLVGRDHELQQLRQVVKRAIEYQAPQLVTVVGNQGTGKTRLVSEWCHGIEAPTRVYRGRAISRNARYSAVARLLRHRLGIGENEEMEAERARVREVVQVVFGDRRVAEVVHFLGTFLDLRFADSPFVRAFDDNPKQHDEIARAVLRRFLEVDASESPIALIFDDLENADEETLTLLEELGETLGGSPIVVCSCSRPEMLVRRPRWGHAGEHTRIELRNLEFREAAQLFRALLDRCDGVPRELVEDAVEMTGGNPFFLEELVRVMIANGTIDTSGTRWRLDPDRAAQTELPISIEAAIEARIAALEPAERDLLEKGATFGNVFWVSALVAVSRTEAVLGDLSRTPPPPPSGWADDGLAERIARMVDDLVERDYVLKLSADDSTIPGDVEVVFKHNLERELIAQMTEPERAKSYHRIAAQWLESKLSDRSEEQFEFLAQLYERGGDKRRAAACYLAGGDKARLRYANEQAIDFYNRGLAMLDYDDALARIDALHNQGDVLARVGRTDEAQIRFGEMLRISWLFDYTAKGGAAHGRIGRLFRQKGEYDQALEHFRIASELFVRANDRRGVASTLSDIGVVHWLRGSYPTALEHHRQALSLRRAIGDKRSIAHSLWSIGVVHRDSGSFKPALEMFREAMELRREIGDKPGVVTSMCDLGAVHEADGNLDEAMQILTDAFELSQDIGDRLLQGEVLGRLAEVELDRGHPQSARGHLDQAQEIFTQLGARLAIAECTRRSAEVQLAVGDGRGATGEAQKALELAEKIGSLVHVGIAHRALGTVLGAQVNTPELLARAEHHFRAAIEVLAALRNELQLARTYRGFATLRDRAGASADAIKLRARADEIFGRLRGAATLKG
jgi:tetratricopeptide (TPR) repeat protein